MNDPIRYARNNEGQHVAYQVSGDGPLDLVFLPDWVTNLEIMREEPLIARFYDRLAAFSRLILLDKRGSGISDPVPLGAIPTIEEWMDDVRTVLDAVDSERAAIFGHGEGGYMAMLFAATHPARVEALVLADTCARRKAAPDYPCGVPESAAPNFIRTFVDQWGTGEALNLVPRSRPLSAAEIARRARLERLAMSPGEFAAIYPHTYEWDARALLRTLQAPTRVLHRAGNLYVRADNGRYLAEHIPGAEFIELEGNEHIFHLGSADQMIDCVQEFLTGTKESPDHDRVLATVLFTDIVGATGLAERLGDRGWKDLLDRHHALVRGELARFRGREMDTAGDGFFATFDGPARGVRCALAIRDVLRTLGLDVRAGVHIGECERIGGKLGGIAVHTGARIMAKAGAGEVLVSRTVKDLVAGSGLRFADAGLHALRGVEGEWTLYSAS